MDQKSATKAWSFTRKNSPDGGFLQSDEWRKFQESVGRRTFAVAREDFRASIMEHKLPVVGRYGYIPRGPLVEFPISNFQFSNNFQNSKLKIQNYFSELIDLAKKNNWGWVRFEPATEEVLGRVKEATGKKIVKSPHDMQPREIFAIDITKPEERLLAEMKPKTRYNIKISQKREVEIIRFKKDDLGFKNSMEEFLRLTKITAKRQGIVTHPDGYYRKMLEAIPAENISLFAAEYQGKIIAAAIVSFFEGTATYLHGSSDDRYRNVMAPFLLQWEAMKKAKKRGCDVYDLGGLKINSKSQIPNVKQIPNSNSPISNNIPETRYQIPDTDWSGITRFKVGFSPETKPIVFPGSYDIIINPWRYWPYRSLQKIKSRIR